MDTPVLFLIFKRPKKTRQVFEAIARAKPRQLFVAADGPRTADEADACRSAREVIERVDWNCEVKTLFRETNLGCKEGVSSAVDWFFEQVEEGIILEDDCLPSDSFFTFCSALLERYRDEERVMMISGNNFQHGIRRGEASYYFSRIPHVWGWATWRRAWRQYDVKMRGFPAWVSFGGAQTAWPDQDVRNYWLSKLIPTYENRIVTWDYQWFFCVMSRSVFSICPQVNLVTNIGFGEGATNTFNEDDLFAQCARHEMSEWTHPERMEAEEGADCDEYLKMFNVKYHSIKNPFLQWRKMLRRRWKIRRMIKRFAATHCVQQGGE